jgi:hypothetical protein
MAAAPHTAIHLLLFLVPDHVVLAVHTALNKLFVFNPCFIVVPFMYFFIVLMKSETYPAVKLAGL